jgi:hypothetical protein
MLLLLLLLLLLLVVSYLGRNCINVEIHRQPTEWKCGRVCHMIVATWY